MKNKVNFKEKELELLLIGIKNFKVHFLFFNRNFILQKTKIYISFLKTEILEFPQINEESKLQKYSKLMELANDFVHFSKIYGKIIIFEAFFKPNEKTIKPVNIGGHAGGPKYIHHGIYFKFATDWESIYGSDENAAKAGSFIFFCFPSGSNFNS